jgi:hypothetical protein
MKVGDPVPLDDLRARPRTMETINEATRRIMDSLTTLVADLRHEPAPTERFDPRRAGIAETGDPHRGEPHRKRGRS